jgi:hypothetical protein
MIGKGQIVAREKWSWERWIWAHIQYTHTVRNMLVFVTTIGTLNLWREQWWTFISMTRTNRIYLSTVTWPPAQPSVYRKATKQNLNNSYKATCCF